MLFGLEWHHSFCWQVHARREQTSAEDCTLPDPASIMPTIGRWPSRETKFKAFCRKHACD